MFAVDIHRGSSEMVVIAICGWRSNVRFAAALTARGECLTHSHVRLHVLCRPGRAARTVANMSADTHNRILDALEELLLKRGLSGVTLENVASNAGISKGGLLYHFQTKDAMIEAMVRRLGQRSEQLRARAAAAEAGTTIVNWFLQQPGSTSDKEIALHRSMLAALRSIDTSRREIFTMICEVMGLWGESLRSEISDPVHAEIVRLVGDGIYLNALVALPPIDPSLHGKIAQHLRG
jgi:AcrR family transcriptional regulator